MYHQNPGVRIAISEEIDRIEAMQAMGDYTNGLDGDVLYSAEGAAFRLAKLKALLEELSRPPGYRAPEPLPAPVIQEPERARDDLLDFDAEPELPLEMTGDELLNAFEKDEGAAAVLIQTLSALRQKHISEQLNVERARLDREHQATGVANPRSAQIDRLLGLLTRRGEV